MHPKRQCVDVYPIENVWAILYEKARAEEFHSVEDMKEYLKKLWVEIDADLGDRMMQ